MQIHLLRKLWTKGFLMLLSITSLYIDERTIMVQDSLMALQELAKFHRAYLKLPIIALTGSNGRLQQKSLFRLY
jgi:UDP-N-acetylmuramoyl-tripeptide--D-alanyl-D-alanine ligase